MNKKLSPCDLDKFLTLEGCRKINIDAFIRQANKDLKRSLLEANLEANNVKVELTTTKTRFGGEKYWFSCPSCKRRCGVLYQHLIKQQVACRKCLGICYAEQMNKELECIE